MYRSVPLLLVLAICAQTFYNVGVLVYWAANHSYIATTLCENKDKPELECDGKCYLKKNLDQPLPQTSDSEHTALPNLKKGIELAEYLEHTGMPIHTEHASALVALIPIRKEGRDRLRYERIFHPPALRA